MKWLDYVIRDWRIRKALPHLTEAKVILDIGCGDGELCRILSKRGIVGVGIDACVNETFEALGFEMISGSFPDALPNEKSFDAISMLAVLEHISEGQKLAFIKACHERLSTDGVVVLTVPSPKVDVLLIVLRFLRLVDGMAFEEHHGFNPAQVEPLFESVGFNLLAHKTFQFGLNNLFIFKKTNLI